MTHQLLFVDDDAAIRFAVERFFRTRGYAVHTAADVAGATARMGADHVDVLIVDLRLTGTQGTEGLDLISLMRSISPATRTILLTAYQFPGLDLTAREQGVDIVLQKPQPLARLAELVGELLSDRQ